MKLDMERRFVATDFEVRSEGGKFVFEGYALKWDVKSQNLGGFREKVAEGATTKTIQEADIRALFNHDPNLILGRNKPGTLRMSEDTTGLYYAVDMPDTSYARDLAVSMERGDVSQSSFGFRTITDAWGLDEDDFPIRTLREIALYDVSPVTYPAYTDSTSGLGKRALERLGEARGIADLSGGVMSGAVDLRSVINGDFKPTSVEDEPDPEARGTTLVIPMPDAAFETALRARMLNL